MNNNLEQKNNFEVFDFGGQARTPIIEEQLFLNTRTPWIYWGIANLAPQELIKLYNSAPTHRACLYSKWLNVRGKGITLEDGDDQRLMMANSLGDTIYDIYYKCSLDFLLFGSFSLNVVWKNDRDNGFELYYIDTSKLRAERQDFHDKVNAYYYCADWTQPKKTGNVPRRISAFNPSNEEPSQIFFYRTHCPSYHYYSSPSYWAAATAIATETEIYNFWHTNIVNGLNPSLWVSLNSGIPDPDTRENIYQTLSSKYSGSNSAGKLFLTFAESKDQAPEVTAIQPNGSDKLFIEMNDAVQQSILTAHQSHPSLLGIQTPGKLDNSSDFAVAQDHYQHLVVEPLMQEIVSVFEKILMLRDKKPAHILVKPFEMISNRVSEAEIKSIDPSVVDTEIKTEDKITK